MARWHPSQCNMRQELFLRALPKANYNAAEAYREVYKCSPRVSWVNACRLLKQPHVQRRFGQLQERWMRKSDISVDKILTDYQVALEMAKGQNKPADIVAAATAQAKLVGLLRERVETGGVGDFPETGTIEDILATVSREAGPEAAMTFAAMFGLSVPETTETRQAKEAALFIADPPSDAVN